MNKQVLFISIDGMTDMLGQSQVLPYLTGLSSKGYKISIVSCEKKEGLKKNKDTVSAITTKYNISWKYCLYADKIPIISQIKNFLNLKELAKKQVIKTNKAIFLHCRSYLAGLIGLQLKQKYNIAFIFDMRGFWANERIDGNIWNLNKIAHKFLFNYFKRKEVEMIRSADYIITLTNNAKQEIQSWKIKPILNIAVIPCCTDVDHFLIGTNEQNKTNRSLLNIDEKTFVLGYLGALGTWYMLDEMLDFFTEFKNKRSNCIFFFVTNDNKQNIIEAATRKNINPNSIVVRSAKRSEVPAYISCFDIGLFFIKPLYSKKGSSPTKLAEMLACGVPVVTNTKIGDVDELILKTNCGVLVSSFNANEYRLAIDKISSLTLSKQNYREVALTNFSLQKGVLAYKNVYDDIQKV